SRGELLPHPDERRASAVVFRIGSRQPCPDRGGLGPRLLERDARLQPRNSPQVPGVAIVRDVRVLIHRWPWDVAGPAGNPQLGTDIAGRGVGGNEGPHEIPRHHGRDRADAPIESDGAAYDRPILIEPSGPET